VLKVTQTFFDPCPDIVPPLGDTPPQLTGPVASQLNETAFEVALSL
jgi:hypothetical protein